MIPEFKFTEYWRGKKTLEDMGYLVKTERVYPDPLPRNYPVDEGEPRPLAFLSRRFKGALVFTKPDNDVLREQQDRLRKELGIPTV